ncbi:hypothetical protein WCP94_003587 [Bilophila wadsworthia]
MFLELLSREIQSKYTTSCKLATSAAAHEFHQFLADEQSKLVGTEEPA